MVAQTMHSTTPVYDRSLVFVLLSLLAIGLVMVTSSSMYYAEENMAGQSYYFVKRHFIYLCLAGVMFAAVTLQPIRRWQQFGPYLLIAGLVLLVAVLFIGRSVNGAKRWIALGPISIQVSEFIKLFVIAYIAGYLVRRSDELQTQIKGFIRPLIVLGVVTFLLLLQPDFGAAVVIVASTLAMLFLAGAKLWQFIGLSLSVSLALVAIAVSQPYRLARLTSFLNPWDDPFGAGYQLTQSLIAFGRGSIWGQGLGNSLQKLSYLPEAHTDFIFAVLAEEFGLVGVLLVLALFLYLFVRAMQIGYAALRQKRAFAAYLAYGIGFWLTFQALINIGVVSGALPTKGLTLPFISYGGNSLMVGAMAIGILLRIDYETRLVREHYILAEDTEQLVEVAEK